MIDIYAQTFMTAARSNCVTVNEIQKTRKNRWIPGRLWGPSRTRCIDLNRL